MSLQFCFRAMAFLRAVSFLYPRLEIWAGMKLLIAAAGTRSTRGQDVNLCYIESHPISDLQ
jgi:hypothetical protein